jgi:hypothetical protein
VEFSSEERSTFEAQSFARKRKLQENMPDVHGARNYEVEFITRVARF